VSDPRKKIVEDGYNTIAEHYLDWSGRIEDDPRKRFLSEFSQLLPVGALVLELGCGAGEPSTRLLAQRFNVIGLDISVAQLRLAEHGVPSARFVRADMSNVSFPTSTFAGISALYSILHLPRDEHRELFHRIAEWLEPGGYFLAVLGTGGSVDWTGEWLGVPMFFSSHDVETNRKLLLAAGFEILRDEVVELFEPEGRVTFQWVLAHKP
jgi:SAM-dependent methyltransferase